MMKFLFSIFAIFITLFNCCFAVDLDTKIGQMLIVGFDGNSIESDGFKRVLNQSKNGEISGIILFQKNIKSQNDLIKLNEELIAQSPITPFISIDNEGGYIQRHDFIKNKSAKEVSKLSSKEAKKEYDLMAHTLKNLKINLNFAPCVDLEINQDSIIKRKERSYGTNPNIVSKYAKIFIKSHNEQKIGTSIKHFPGHGSVKGDTHLGFVNATKTFKEDEIIPYYNLKNYDKLNMVMVSHIFNSYFDKNYPASLSKNTINFLKEDIGFDGLIISDDYDMGAIRKNYSLREIVVRSINAGINVLVFSNNIQIDDETLPIKIRKIIKEEIIRGNIKIQDVEKSYQKIIEYKKRLNS